jgi:hypothetical protein
VDRQRLIRNKREERRTVEKLAVDCLDAREMSRAGLLRRSGILRYLYFRWPRIERMRADSYSLEIELRNRVTPQIIRLSWTPCHFGGQRPWLHCPHCQRRVARLFLGFGYSVGFAWAARFTKASLETRSRGCICEPVDCEKSSAARTQLLMLCRSVRGEQPTSGYVLRSND